MNPEVVGVMVAVLVIGAIVALKLTTAQGRKRRRLANVEKVSEALRLTRRHKAGLLDYLKVTPVAEGVVGGYGVALYHHAHSGGRHAANRYFNGLEIRASGHGDFTFRLEPTDRELVTRRRGQLALNVNAVFGIFGDDVLTGDAAFDEAYKISCDHPEKLSAVLDREVRARLLANRAAGTFDLNQERLHYYEFGPFLDEAEARRFIAMGEVLVMIGQRVWSRAP